MTSVANIECLGRPFSSNLDAKVWDDIQAGTMRNVYRKVPFYKSPFDIALYLQLLARLEPRTIIEIGTKYGGSALWFADMLTAQGGEVDIVSVDIAPEVQFADPRITFLTGDANRLEDVLSQAFLASKPRPWLIIEDSSHFYRETRAVLDFFHSYLQAGDYIVVEDGIVGQLSGDHYLQYNNGPSHALSEFLSLHPDTYEVDIELCDHFGFNTTYNPNGWLRKT